MGIRRKFILFLLAVLSVVWFLSAGASAAGTDITGPDTLAPGDTITIEFALTECQDVRSVQGDIIYDPDKLALQEIIPDLKEPWSFDKNEGGGRIRFLGFDTSMEAPVNGYQKLFTLTFLVEDGLTQGEEIKIEAREVSVSDGESDVDAVLTAYIAKVGESGGAQVPVTNESQVQSDPENEGGPQQQESGGESSKSQDVLSQQEVTTWLLIGAGVVVVLVIAVSFALSRRKKG